MMTQEELMLHLTDNPEEKEWYDEMLKFYFPKWISEKYKKEFVETLPEEDKEFIFHMIQLTSISDNELDIALPKEEFITIKELFTDVMKGNDELIAKLIEIYEKNVDIVVGEYVNKVQVFKYKKLPKQKRNQVDNLKIKKQCEKADKILADYYRGNPNKIMNLIDYIDKFKSMSKIFNISIFTSQALKINPSILDKVSYAVYNPGFLIPPVVDNILNESMSLPCEWYLYRKLTLNEYKEFTTNLSDVEIWRKYFNNAIKSIKEQIQKPVGPIKYRQELIEEIIDNIHDKRYGSAIITIFSVIEGLLWDFTYEINKVKKVYDGSKVFDCDKMEMFESTRIRDVLERTNVREYLDSGFLEYFCNELYEERNPILHGRRLCNKCEKVTMTIIYKIFTLDYILICFNQTFEKNLFNIWDKSFSSEKVREFIDMVYYDK